MTVEELKINLSLQARDGHFFGNKTEEQAEMTYRLNNAAFHHRERGVGCWWYEGPYLSIYESYGDVAPMSTAGHNMLFEFEPADYKYNESKKDRFAETGSLYYIYSGTKTFDRVIDVFKRNLKKEDFEKYFGKFVK